jgi:hypothetical protein
VSRGRRLVISRVDGKTGDYFMKRRILTPIRCLVILLVPAVAYALSTQLATHGGKANKNQVNTKPSQHTVTHNKPTARRNVHASHAMHGQHSAGGGAHVQHMQTHQHSLPRGRSSTGGSPTPTPTPATEAATPAPDLTATATPSPTE